MIDETHTRALGWGANIWEQIEREGRYRSRKQSRETETKERWRKQGLKENFGDREWGETTVERQEAESQGLEAPARLSAPQPAPAMSPMSVLPETPTQPG